MDKKKYMCYITYAVPSDELKDFLTENDCTRPISVQTQPEDRGVFPEGFVPAWFKNGGFPEDDF